MIYQQLINPQLLSFLAAAASASHEKEPGVCTHTGIPGPTVIQPMYSSDFISENFTWPEALNVLRSKLTFLATSTAYVKLITSTLSFIQSMTGPLEVPWKWKHSKNGKKKKIKGKKKCLRTQKLQEKFLQSLLRNSIPNKTTQYIIKQKKKNIGQNTFCA